MNLKRVGAIMLMNDAIKRYQKLSKTTMWDEEDLIYNAGWDKYGEWTCCKCGAMIGKNLNGHRPFALARKHAKDQRYRKTTCDPELPQTTSKT
jgi:hypothetical protein